MCLFCELLLTGIHNNIQSNIDNVHIILCVDPFTLFCISHYYGGGQYIATELGLVFIFLITLTLCITADEDTKGCAPLMKSEYKVSEKTD